MSTGAVTIEPDGTMRDQATGESCKPPAPLYFFTEGYGDVRVELNLSGLCLDEQTLDALIDTYAFFKRRNMNIFAE